MIQYSEHAPCPTLRPFIECLWVLQSESDVLKKLERIIPGGRTEMMFNFGDQVHWIDSESPLSKRVCKGAYLLGPRNRHFFVEHTGSINLLGVRFRHGGLSAFTPVPMSVLMNEIVAQEEVFGKGAEVLMNQLREKPEANVRRNLIEAFLKKQLQFDARQSFELITEIKRYESISPLSLTEKTGIHYKKLERVFSKYTGYTPKNFSRVIRFYNALRQMQQPSFSLTSISLDGGYYDQPHFIRDFKEFTGKSPSQFQAENPTIANLLLKSKHV